MRSEAEAVARVDSIIAQLSDLKSMMQGKARDLIVDLA